VKLVESPIRATFLINELGKLVLKENPEAIDQEYLMKFDSFKEFKKNIDNLDDDDKQDKTIFRTNQCCIFS